MTCLLVWDMSFGHRIIQDHLNGIMIKMKIFEKKGVYLSFMLYGILSCRGRFAGWTITPRM